MGVLGLCLILMVDLDLSIFLLGRELMLHVFLNPSN